MNRSATVGLLALVVLTLAFGTLPVAFAQGQTHTMNTPGIDLSGQWSEVNSSDANMDQPGSEPGPVDFLGVPINDAARRSGEMYSLAELSEPERQCVEYPPFYLMLGPFGLRIWAETEPRNGRAVAWIIGGWEDMPPITIWMDGRPHPGSLAPHEIAGFTTGEWHDDVLVSVTTHMRAQLVRRNGTPMSDKAVMTLWFLRHENELTILARVEDPVFLTEPYLMTRTWNLFWNGPMPTVGIPCIITDEGMAEGIVPFYLPGQNPFMRLEGEAYGIPQDAMLGGAKTMYPDYRSYLKDKYVRPKICPRSQASNPRATCGGAGMYDPQL